MRDGRYWLQPFLVGLNESILYSSILGGAFVGPFGTRTTLLIQFLLGLSAMLLLSRSAYLTFKDAGEEHKISLKASCWLAGGSTLGLLISISITVWAGHLESAWPFVAVLPILAFAAYRKGQQDQAGPLYGVAITLLMLIAGIFCLKGVVYLMFNT